MKNNHLTGDTPAALEDSQSSQPAQVLAQLQQYIMQQLPQAPKLTDAASTLNMSSRSLQRALQQADTSFRQLMCQCRHQLANHYLQDASLSLQHIAFQLGFAEQSSFQKAFKCWQGCSPGVFRQRQQLTTNRRRHLSGLQQPGLQVNYEIN